MFSMSIRLTSHVAVEGGDVMKNTQLKNVSPLIMHPLHLYFVSTILIVL